LLNTRTPTGPLYRIAWGTEPWEYPDWKRAGTDSSSQAHTFGNRFDDPNAEYRVLYAASQFVSCYVEVLARFRPDYALLAELRAMDGEDDYQQIGIVSDEWFENRFIGIAEVEGNYADLYSPAWVSHLRSRLQPLCVELGLPDFDVSVLIQATKRIVTQRASSMVYDLGAFAGIYYASRQGLGLENWALFEFKAIIKPLIPVQQVSKIDPSLKQALEILHLGVAD
jgi:hypothetical protein